MKKRFDWPDFLKRVSAIAIPVALQNLLTTTGSMVDTMMIGSLGEINVAAVGLCAQFSMLMFSCYWGFVGGGMLFFSQYWGNGDHKSLKKSYGLTTSCLMFVSIVFCLAALLFAPQVMTMYTDKQAVRDIGVSYLRIVGFAYPLQVFSVAIGTLLRSTEKVIAPLVASIISVATNIFFNWVFIFGNLGAKAMGVRGAALATTIAAAVNLAVVIIYAIRSKNPHVFAFREHFNWDGEFIRLFFKKCFPIICNELFLGIATLVINIVLGHQVEEAIAAVAVFRTIEGLIIGFFAGFSNAATVLVGKFVGSGDLDIAYERAKRLIYLCQGVVACIVLLVFAFHTPLFHVMGLSGLSFEYATGLIVIYGIACIIRMGNWCMNDTYRSAGDSTTGTVLEIVFMYVLILPTMLILWKLVDAPFLIVFASGYIDEPIRYVIMQRHMYSGKWIRPVTPEGKAKVESFLASIRK